MNYGKAIKSTEYSLQQILFFLVAIHPNAAAHIYCWLCLRVCKTTTYMYIYTYFRAKDITPFLCTVNCVWFISEVVFFFFFLFFSFARQTLANVRLCITAGDCQFASNWKCLTSFITFTLVFLLFFTYVQQEPIESKSLFSV